METMLILIRYLVLRLLKLLTNRNCFSFMDFFSKTKKKISPAKKFFFCTRPYSDTWNYVYIMLFKYGSSNFTVQYCRDVRGLSWGLQLVLHDAETLSLKRLIAEFHPHDDSCNYVRANSGAISNQNKPHEIQAELNWNNL